MSQECCCGGRCKEMPPVAMSRREFLERVAASAAAMAVASQVARAAAAEMPQPVPTLPSQVASAAYPLTAPRTYTGENLQAVAMPIGGIGTGSIWLDGRGRLSVWQIFNNLSEPRIPGSFFAVRARTGDQDVVRVLQTEAEGPLASLASLEYEGGYPIARLAFQDPQLPVQVSLEALNPLIPTDAYNSSIPCAIFRLTARNTGASPAEVSLFASLQNAVGSRGAGDVRGVKLPGYGGNRNRAVQQPQFVAVAMDKSPDPVASGPLTVRDSQAAVVAGPELYWQAGAADLNSQLAESLARIAGEGGTLLIDGVQPGFFQTIAALREASADSPATVFEDFERGDYEGWKLEGSAFGSQPSRGTEAGQQKVSGFAGRRLVNTFIAGDGPQGKATSKPFRIEKRYIGFLIGGGKFAKQTCVNLRVDDRVVRTAAGKNREALEPHTWDVAEFADQNAVLEIVDAQSGPWGHINVDQIVFSDVPPEAVLREGTTITLAAKAVQVPFTSVAAAPWTADGRLAIERAELSALAETTPWTITQFTRLEGFEDGKAGYRVLAATDQGLPLLIEGPLGKGRVILALAPQLPWQWGSLLLTRLGGRELKPGEQLLPGDPGWGSMTLAALDPQAVPLTGWKDPEQLLAFIQDPQAAVEEAISAAGETLNAALGVPFTLQAGQQRSVTFVITWHFPNVQRFHHAGNLYSRRWRDALQATEYVAAHGEALWARTRLYHETLYQSNLPEEFLDAMASQIAILRGPTCFWSEDGYFGGFEGSYGCCPLNCTHVWNYAQSHARLFPEVGQNMRVSDFITYLHDSGETSHRQHGPHAAFMDGHCACIEAAYREHQLSHDNAFLEQIWPGVKKSVDWIVEAIDKDRDGVPAGHQWNTYDTAVSGANTFIGSQFLSALAAAEQMALVMSDPDSAQRWRTVREAGMKNQDQQLWNGQYYIQIPESPPARDYNNGCHSDQLLGQWWAHMLNLGYLYPPERVRAALQAVMKHNYRQDFAGFKQNPRRYVRDDEGGLLMCTWPGDDRPQPFILYADEVWTGIEYSTAGAMIYEGLIDEARQIVRTARSRYDGRTREGLNSGPGGNPYNELECGKFYARALSSWSLLIASQGQVLDGPQGLLGFQPHWQPADHRSLFTAPAAWGLFVQQRGENEQTERIELRHGRLRLCELAFELPPTARAPKAAVKLDDRPRSATVHVEARHVRLVLEQELSMTEGQTLEVVWQFDTARG